MQAVGADTVVAVQRISVVTLPSEVAFDYLVPAATYAPGGVFDQARAELAVRPIADRIETYIGQGLASGASYSEDLNAAGLVEFYIDFVVTIPPPSGRQPGPHETIARVPISALEDSNIANAVARPILERALAVVQGFASM